MQERIVAQCTSLPARLAIGVLMLAGIASWLRAEGTSLLEANIHDVQPGESVPVAKIPDGIYLRTVNDPDDIVWERLTEYRVQLTPAPAVHASVGLRHKPDDPGVNMIFTVARTDERLYVRLRWRDDTRDVQTLNDRFRDGVAAQFSLGDSSTSYIMGNGPDAPVNIWYWHADNNEVENLAAGGFGSTTQLPEQPVSGASQYLDKGGDANEWVVVMSRPLPVDGEHQVSFDQETVPMALAVWQGSAGERDGLKAVTLGWLNLQLKDAS